MKLAPIPPFEDERMRRVQELGILDTKPEERFDAITREATERFGVPISTISIIDKNREWYKSCQGLDTREGDRSISFCGHAMLAPIIFIVQDTMLDDRFKDNPSVVGAPFIRFYAGVALREHASGQVVGVLCIKDTQPRIFSQEDTGALIELGKKAEIELNKPAA